MKGSNVIERAVFAILAMMAACVAQAADGTWVKRTGVGTGGTNWTEWSDAANWQGGVIASNTASEAEAVANVHEAKGQYIRLPDGTLSLKRINGLSAAFRDQWPVLAGDGVLNIPSPAGDCGGIYLYSDWKWNHTGNYNGLTDIDLCGTCLSSPADKMLFIGAARFRYDLFANSADAFRTNDIFRSWMHFKDNGGQVHRFYAPKGSDVDLVRTFAQTAGTPFLSPVGEVEILPVGTVVSGVGIPAGTFLRRIFPDGTIELSTAASKTISENALTFAAFAPRVYQSFGIAGGFNGTSAKTLAVQKYREQDDIRLSFSSIRNLSGDAAHNAAYTITTDAGFVPGTIVLASAFADESYLNLKRAHLEVHAAMTGLSLSVPDAGDTARLTVPTGKSASVKVIAALNGVFVKDGEGELSAGVTNGYTGTVTVEAGTFAPKVPTAGVAVYLPSLTVRAGGTLAVPPEGLHVGVLVLEENATISGNGILEYDTADDSVFPRISVNGGGLRRFGAAPTGVLSLEVTAGTYHSWSEDGDTVLIFESGLSTIKIDGRGVLDLLCVGGGGGGGSYGGGGGGGGGVVYTQTLEVVSGYYGVNVGVGGEGSKNAADAGENGGDSSAFGVIAIGGGGGGTKSTGGSGGSGGGAGAYKYMEAKTLDGGTGFVGQGHAGGKSETSGTSHWHSFGGGGGGAGTAGQDAEADTKAGNGGEGVRCAIWSADRVYGSGGGGGTGVNQLNLVGTGGTGAGDGGANGSATTSWTFRSEGGPGTDGWGGGGGGGGRYVDKSGNGGNGGSGIVVVRFRREINENLLPEAPIAEGGRVRRRNGYAFHTFTTNGTFTVPQNLYVDVLAVGGGGGGGTYAGGGGGGGGVTVISNLLLSAGTYPVEVGLGGAGAPSWSVAAKNGGLSMFYTGVTNYSVIAQGGGRGGIIGDSGGNGANGGGGGGSYPYNGAARRDGGKALAGKGFDGGASTNCAHTVSWNNCFGGGGGGAGAAGVTAEFEMNESGVLVRYVPGDGGDGVCLDFAGAPTWYGGGGGGAANINMQETNQDVSKGGRGGGGIGRATWNGYCYPGTDGVDGLGGGGGGGSGLGDSYAGSGGSSDHGYGKGGGNGGSGLVVIRYRIAAPIGGLQLLIR